MNELIHWFTQLYNIQELIKWGGLFGMMFIVFAETGLMVGFFLPGDSLLVTAGILTYRGVIGTNVWLTCCLLSICAMLGNSLGYFIGSKSGPRLFKKEKSILFNPKHLVTTHQFFEKHGGKTIIIAQFVPILRTFSPVVAGIGRMSYLRFISYNVFGAVFWVFSMVLLGYFLGSIIPGIDKRIDRVIIAVIAVSLMPMLIHYLNERRKKRKAALVKEAE